MNPTQMRNMTDAELTNSLDDARHQSPVIGELCRRLEEYATREPTGAQAECPVCMAELQAEFDEGNGILELKVAT